MTISYMIIWSTVMVIGLSLLRVRQLRLTVVMSLVSALVLVSSHALFSQLSLGAGIDPATMTHIELDRYLAAGLTGWLALIVLPCGWLGPVVGLHLVERLQQRQLVEALLPLTVD